MHTPFTTRPNRQYVLDALVEEFGPGADLSEPCLYEIEDVIQAHLIEVQGYDDDDARDWAVNLAAVYDCKVLPS